MKNGEQQFSELRRCTLRITHDWAYPPYEMRHQTREASYPYWFVFFPLYVFTYLIGLKFALCWVNCKILGFFRTIMEFIRSGNACWSWFVSRFLFIFLLISLQWTVIMYEFSKLKNSDEHCWGEVSLGLASDPQRWRYCSQVVYAWFQTQVFMFRLRGESFWVLLGVERQKAGLKPSMRFGNNTSTVEGSRSAQRPPLNKDYLLLLLIFCFSYHWGFETGPLKATSPQQILFIFHTI